MVLQWEGLRPSFTAYNSSRPDFSNSSKLSANLCTPRQPFPALWRPQPEVRIRHAGKKGAHGATRTKGQTKLQPAAVVFCLSNLMNLESCQSFDSKNIEQVSGAGVLSPFCLPNLGAWGDAMILNPPHCGTLRQQRLLVSPLWGFQIARLMDPRWQGICSHFTLLPSGPSEGRDYVAILLRSTLWEVLRCGVCGAVARLVLLKHTMTARTLCSPTVGTRKVPSLIFFLFL